MKKYILPLIAFVLVCGTLVAQQQVQPTKLFTNKQINGSNEFSGRTVSGVKWIDGGRKFSYQESDATTNSTKIWLHHVSNGRKELVVDTKDLKLQPNDPPRQTAVGLAFSFTSYQWTPGEKQILLAGKPPEGQYFSRLMPAGNLFLYDLPSKKFRQLTNVSTPQYNQKFSPDGKLIGFVRENNIYTLDLTTGVETQLTSDGKENIINGKFDWVYEEEFGISDGWQWSPDGKMIAYWQLDESPVPQFHMFNVVSLRSDVMGMRYPKAGDANSKVRIGVISVQSKQTMWMDIGTETDIYIPRIHWIGTRGKLVIQRMNRWQNKLELLVADVATGKTTVIFTEEDKKWVEVHDDLTFLGTGDRFVWTSERSGFNHIYIFETKGNVLKPVTKGGWEVGNIVQVDERNGLIYSTGREKSALENHLYVVKFDGSGLRRLTPGDYNYSVNVAPGGKHFIGNYSNVSTPTKVGLFGADGKMIRMLEENELPSLKEYKMGKHEFFRFETTDGVQLNGWMIKPIDFDPLRKFPVLLYVYGGPGSQTVVNSWGGARYLWHQMLAQNGYIVASVDGRGTGQRGKEFKSITYMNLGKWEVNDQIEAAKFFGSQAYVDKTRIGIWGWSYGGYMASLTILLGADYFKTAVAVAPVTDWKFYDTIYTERFMRRPVDNPDGYRESAPTTHAAKLKGNLLLIHGTTDDNVHWQNSAVLGDELQKAGKQFQTMFYANKNHGIGGSGTRTHLFELITNYILEKL